jgi:hypothetical protein
MKASSSACRSPAGDEGFLHHDKGFRRKMEEWERMKHPQQNQGGSTKHRDSVAFQTLDEDSLSPDFRKKLQVRILISILQSLRLYSVTSLKRNYHQISSLYESRYATTYVLKHHCHVIRVTTHLFGLVIESIGRLQTVTINY